MTVSYTHLDVYKRQVEREEYERAAKIRDRIRELTSKGDGSDGKA